MCEEAGHGGWCLLFLSVHQTRRSWTQSQSKIHWETHSPKEQDPETLTMTPYSNHASETENQKASRVIGEWQGNTCDWEPREERLSEEDNFSSGVWGHSGQHRELPTYNTIQHQENQENQCLYYTAFPYPTSFNPSCPIAPLGLLYHLHSTILPPLKSSQYPPSKFLTLWIFHFKHTYLKDSKPGSTPESEPVAFVFLNLGYLHVEWLFPDPSIYQQIS